jgi:hypothetical protein
MDDCDRFVVHLREVYEKWDRKALIATLLSRDAEIERLRRREAGKTLDDHVMLMIEAAMAGR